MKAREHPTRVICSRRSSAANLKGDRERSFSRMRQVKYAKRGGKVMEWVLGCTAVLVIGLVIWLGLPYSAVRSEFRKMTDDQMQKAQALNGVFTEQDIANLPSSVQRYYRYCGFLGKPKMANMRAYYDDVDFVLNNRKLKIKYTQYNFSVEPVRVAYIDAGLYGIPFEGLDAYTDGTGVMKGVLAKGFTLFDQRGGSMDRSSLVTCLAESLLIPQLALQDFITWEEIDATHAKAAISYYGISAGGIFEFSDQGEMIRFTTGDREYMDTHGRRHAAEWSAVCGDYQEVNGIKSPSTLKAIWHLATGDLIYFDGRGTVIEYDVKQ